MDHPWILSSTNAPPDRPQLSYGKALRLSRVFSESDGRALVVPLDHSVSDGPLPLTMSLPDLVREIAPVTDAIVVHKGTARRLPPECFQNTRLIVHLSASTGQALDPDAKYLVSSVEAAARLGADAVSVHVNLAAVSEPQQISDLGLVADECDLIGIPLMAMVYPRGPKIENPRDPSLVAHAASLAADLGADIVKVPFTGDVESMRRIVAECPIPILVAGGTPPREVTKLMGYVRDVASSGVAGLAMGRSIFSSSAPGSLAATVAAALHATPIANPVVASSELQPSTDNHPSDRSGKSRSEQTTIPEKAGV